MKRDKKTKDTDQLASLFTRDLMDVPSAEFSDKLLHQSMTSYRISYSAKYRKEERLGKVIIVILIFFNLMMLYVLNPFDMPHAVLLGLLAFIVGIGVLLRMHIFSSLFQTTKLKFLHKHPMI